MLNRTDRTGGFCGLYAFDGGILRDDGLERGLEVPIGAGKAARLRLERVELALGLGEPGVRNPGPGPLAAEAGRKGEGHDHDRRAEHGHSRQTEEGDADSAGRRLVVRDDEYGNALTAPPDKMQPSRETASRQDDYRGGEFLVDRPFSALIASQQGLHAFLQC